MARYGQGQRCPQVRCDRPLNMEEEATQLKAGEIVAKKVPVLRNDNKLLRFDLYQDAIDDLFG